MGLLSLSLAKHALSVCGRRLLLAGITARVHIPRRWKLEQYLRCKWKPFTSNWDSNGHYIARPSQMGTR